MQKAVASCSRENVVVPERVSVRFLKQESRASSTGVWVILRAEFEV